MYYTYKEEECQRVSSDLHLCPQEDLREIHDEAPCEVKLLISNRIIPTCKQVEAKVTEVMLNQLGDTNKWILVCPKEETMRMCCQEGQNEAKTIKGTFLCEIPKGCRISIGDKFVNNKLNIVKSDMQPILFPDLNKDYKIKHSLNLSLHLPELKLDDFHKLKGEILQDSVSPNLMTDEISISPSVWTLLVYVILIGLCLGVIWKRILQPKIRKRKPIEANEALQEPIQFPRQA